MCILGCCNFNAGFWLVDRIFGKFDKAIKRDAISNRHLDDLPSTSKRIPICEDLRFAYAFLHNIIVIGRYCKSGIDFIGKTED